MAAARRGGTPSRPTKAKTAAKKKAAEKPAAAPKKPVRNRHEQALLARARAYAGVTSDQPWGHWALKVKGKTFLFLSKDDAELSLSVKLPESGAVALLLEVAEPTGYGLGKSGWVSAKFPPGASPPLDMLFDWLDESYRAVAPKALAKAARPA